MRTATLIVGGVWGMALTGDLIAAIDRVRILLSWAGRRVRNGAGAHHRTLSV